jgi:cytochrome P450
MLFFVIVILILFSYFFIPALIRRSIFFYKYNKNTPSNVQVKSHPIHFGLGQFVNIMDENTSIDSYIGFANSAIQNGQDLTIMNFGMAPWILVTHPKYVKQLCVSQYTKFRKAKSYENAKVVLGEGLVTSEANLWKMHRSIINPIFSEHNINRMLVQMHDLCEDSMKAWSDSDSGFTMDFSEQISELTLRVISSVAFGITDYNKIDRVASIWNSTSSAFSKYFLGSLLLGESIFKRLPLSRTTQMYKQRDELFQIARNILNERSDTDNAGLLRLLQQAKDESMTEQHLIDHAVTFLLAGSETTSGWLSWLFYELAKNPDIQDRVYNDIDGVWQEFEQGYIPDLSTLLNSFKFLPNVLNESLRLHPPVFIVDKEPLEDIFLGEHFITKGVCHINFDISQII